jgi:hypothetical protein
MVRKVEVKSPDLPHFRKASKLEAILLSMAR